MINLAAAKEFLDLVRHATTNHELYEALAIVCAAMGFDYFALTHHVDFTARGTDAVRLHNYPPNWVAWFDENGLGVTDPVHRASQITSAGFLWDRVPGMIKLTTADRDVLERARGEGIGDGFTVPAHIPGEASGSCSFAVAPSSQVCDDHLPIAQLVGAFAFEAARRINQIRLVEADSPTLTERQRDCVLWMARGKSDWEMAQILGLSPETCTQHLNTARERFDVAKRPQLAVRALFDGHISFADVFGR
ncbi:LuxR family transcriptional regulator [Sphingomonas soli]|uniref:LuxR family transcriptional regulator n=1 Tax=Sphingomonas soli TaxID=266127 RepID=UPI00082CD154|nr:LuxR family transcriptional regulator [Sphingomonas soli]